jgi:hypothetical protein
MNQKIIGTITTYPGMNQSDWLWQQTPQNFGKWGNIQMLANHPEPDFLLMYQFDFPQPPKKQSWSIKYVATGIKTQKTTFEKNCAVSPRNA